MWKHTSSVAKLLFNLCLPVGLLLQLVLLLSRSVTEAIAVGGLGSLSSGSQGEQVQNYRLHVGAECEQTADCIGGDCRLDPAGNGRKSCMCLDGTFRYVIAPALEICLKCRDLNVLCSFDQECQCVDVNAICDIQAPSGKGRCKCRANYQPFFESRTKSGGRGNFTCKTGGVRSACSVDTDCFLIKFADAHGKLLGLRDSTGRRKSDIQARCLAQPVTAASAAHDDVVTNPEEVDYSNVSIALPPAPNVTTAQPVVLVVPEPRDTSMGNVTIQTAACQCPDGFVASPNDTYVCQDIDECLNDACNPVRLDNAHTNCVNTIGSFHCECNSTMALGQGLVPGICCNDGYVPCLDASRCIPLSRLCDGLPDCEADCSDELYPFCNFNNYHSFPDFSHFPQCHEGLGQEEINTGNVNPNKITTNSVASGFLTQDRYDDQQLLPLGARTPSSRQGATPPDPLPTLPSNMTAARLLGYVLV